MNLIDVFFSTETSTKPISATILSHCNQISKEPKKLQKNQNQNQNQRNYRKIPLTEQNTVRKIKAKIHTIIEEFATSKASLCFLLTKSAIK